MSDQQQQRLFSAPGKLLLAGGYLVLFPEFNSLVVALSSRMHATITSKTTTDVSHKIKIKSPQFLKGEWQYEFGNELTQIGESRNPFIESTLNVFFQYITTTERKDIEITIYSDPEYHSQENTTLKTNGVKKFLFHNEEITKIAKTGLGSSAGLVTVITTALLSQFGKFDKELIHNLSQISHCLAQGKIGSGFDVASATFGSIVYRRFKPELINELVSGDFTNLLKIVDSQWDFEHDSCKLPPSIKLLMGDVSGGSNTPKLVSKVLEWKKLNPEESSILFHSLGQANTKLIDSIVSLSEISGLDPSRYLDLLNTLETHTNLEILSYAAFANYESKNKPLLEIINALKNIRFLLKELTKETKAEIEPFEQTKLLNHCNAIFKGCLGGVVPGAGGYDAICLLCHEKTISKISDCNLENVRWLDLCEDNEGVIEEKFDNYLDLV